MGSINRNVKNKKVYKKVDSKKYIKPVYDYKEKSYLDRTSISYLNQVFESTQKPLKEVKIDIDKKISFETQELEYLIKKVCDKNNTQKQYNLFAN